ncbi:hypothetical protein P692DRAFT_20748215 [Suillus brevipes Sb2]|nr:hypothetical protein P692DRAFT_20748215 [Suillus brevipes Sb2]
MSCLTNVTHNVNHYLWAKNTNILQLLEPELQDGIPLLCQCPLPTKEAQLQVQQFSSTKYKSHRRIPETVARLFD